MQEAWSKDETMNNELGLNHEYCLKGLYVENWFHHNLTSYTLYCILLLHPFGLRR